MRDKLKSSQSNAIDEAQHRIARDTAAVTLPSGDVWVGIKVEDSDTPILIGPDMVAQLRDVFAKLPS